MKNQETVGRIRLANFFDAGTFVELGAYVCRPESTNAEGVVCGYGARAGRLVFAFAQDSTQMKGALDARHAKKIADTYEKAMAAGAPIVGFFDCAGAVVFDGAAALAGYGTLLGAVNAARGVIPQIAVICGACTGTMAAVAASFDLTVVIEGKSRLYTTSPTLIGEEFGSAAFAAESGTAAVVADSEEAALARVGELLSYLPDRAHGNRPETNTDDLNRALTLPEGASAKQVLEAMVDAGRFAPLYASYAEAVTAGFANLGGVSCTVIALDGWLSVDAVRKMTAVQALAGRMGMPIVTLVNCEGILPDADGEAQIAKALADLAGLMTRVRVPRVCAIVGAAIGAGFLFGGAKTLGTDVVLALPSAEIAAMSASAGVAFLWNDRITPECSRYELEAQWRAECASPEAAAATGEIDDIAAPEELRARVLAVLMMLRGKQTAPWGRHPHRRGL